MLECEWVLENAGTVQRVNSVNTVISSRSIQGYKPYMSYLIRQIGANATFDATYIARVS